MRSIPAISLTLVLATTVWATAVWAEPPGADDLGWLAGCWASVHGEEGSGEQWTAPAGGSLLGTNRTVRGGKTVAHEFLQIRETEDGELVYIAAPSGQAAASFTAIEIGERRVVFENPEHDFPQRILYQLLDGGRLDVRIEGEQNGETRSVDFGMTRSRCPS